MKNMQLWLVIIFAIVATTSCTFAANTPPAGNSNPSAPVPAEKILSTFRPIEGTNYLMAEISANPNLRETSSNPLEWIRSGYSSYSYQTYNYVFFDLDSESYNRLLPDNNAVILQTIGFPTPVYDSSANAEPNPPIEWWLFTVVKADTDQNGQLNYQDKQVLGISDVGGNAYKEVITDVDNMLGQVYKDNSSLFVMYHSNSKNYLAKIDLPSGEVIMTTEMDLGSEVK